MPARTSARHRRRCLRPAAAFILWLAAAGGARAFANGGSWRPRRPLADGPGAWGPRRGAAPRRAAEEPAAGGQDTQAILDEAARLRGEAEAAAALLEAQKSLRETRERVEQAEVAAESDPEKEALQVAERLEEAQTKLRKAEAFALPERDGLRKEVAALESRAAELKAQIAGPQPQLVPEPQAPPPIPQAQSGLTRNGKPLESWTDADWEELAAASEDMSVEKRFELAQALGRDGRERLAKLTSRREEQRQKEQEEEEAARAASRAEDGKATAKELRAKLSFEALRDMSNEERFEVAKEAGPAYITSLGIVALCYWALNIPFLAYAYHESTGQWPDLGSIDSLGALGTAGAFAGVFAMYALLKPVRLFVALLVTPWTVENVMPNLPRFDEPKDEGKK